MAVILAGLWVSRTSAEPVPEKVVFDTDFSAHLVPLGEGLGAKPNQRITGALPAGWLEDSAWAQVWADLSARSEDGENFLRFHVTRRGAGHTPRMQIVFPRFPDIRKETLFRVTARVRNLSEWPVNLSIRMKPSPYEVYWALERHFGPQFETLTQVFTVKPNNAPLGFFFSFRGPGIVDVSRIRIERLDREEYARELRETLPDGGPANLLRNSRFPLGLQSGWFIHRGVSDGDDIRVAGDPSVIGPSGAPAMKIESAVPNGYITGETFTLAYPVVPHAATMWVRGSGRWTFGLGNTERFRWEAKVEPSPDEWRRVALPFEPTMGARWYMLNLSGKGVLWVDGLQAGPAGKVAEGYRSAGECEVALALPAAGEPDKSMARVQFLDEPADTVYCVTGLAEDAVLKSRVVDLYGETRPLPDVPLDGARSIQGRLSFDPPAERAIGLFRVETWVERDGTRISPFNELVIARLPRPKYWMKDAPRSPFGVHIYSDTRTILAMKAIGINWVRMHNATIEAIGWYYLEPKPGAWNFQDRVLQRFRRHGLMILGELGTAPHWASRWQNLNEEERKVTLTPGLIHSTRYFPPRDLEDFRRYVRTVAARHRGAISAFTVWNEPWYANWWPVRFDLASKRFYSHAAAPEEYADLMKAAWDAARSVDPGLTIAGINTMTGNEPDPANYSSVGAGEWLKRLVKRGALEACNVMDYHIYTHQALLEKEIEEGYQTAFGPLLESTKGNLPHPVWMTEGSAVGPFRHGIGFFNHTTGPVEDFERDPRATADAQARFVVAHLGLGVEKVFIYSAHVYWGWVHSDLRCLVAGDGTLHPSGVAHAAMARELEDKRIAFRRKLPGGLTGYFFHGADGTVAALAPPPEGSEALIPRRQGVTVRDLFGNKLPEEAPAGRHMLYVSSPVEPAELEKFLLKGLDASEQRPSEQTAP